ncbi:type II secretion system F family protein [Candidatus Parcubacteria bacterium]|nr:type II secretion system F family protein [Candidatus Parcubacteria bacterium]
MPNYFYTARSFDGQAKTGIAQAKDVFSLARSLKSENMLLITAVLEEEYKKHSFSFVLPTLGMSSKEKIMMVRNVWIMFAAGLSLVKIFDILADQAKKPKVKKMFREISGRLTKGEVFSDALARFPKVFGDFFVSMVRIGEESGTLESIFEILSTHMDRDHELRTKIKGALIYPCIILVVMAIMGVVVSTFVLPKFSAFLEGMGVPLPIYTQILIALGNFSQRYWYVSLISPVVAVYGFFLAIKTAAGRLVRDTFLIKTPLLSPFIKKSNAAVVIRSLSSLNSSGISLIRSLEITSATVSNIYFKRALDQAAEKVKKGQKLSLSLKPYKDIFPFGALDMMEVGEETGKTSEILKKLAEFYEGEVIEETKNFSVIIEPLLIVFLGAVVAFFAISIIEPMYSSLNSI